MIAPSANVAESLPDVVYCGTYKAEETVATPTDTESKVGVADAVIVGSALKFNGNWQERVDVNRVRQLMKHIRVS